MKKKIKELIGKCEELFLKYLWSLCAIASLLTAVCYKFKYLVNVRSTMQNVITVASIIFVVISLILTLLISLKGSILFERIRELFPAVSKSIYTFLARVMFSSIIVVLISLFITVLPPNLNEILKFIVSFLALLFFWYMILGTAYMLKFTIDMVVKNDKAKKVNKIQ